MKGSGNQPWDPSLAHQFCFLLAVCKSFYFNFSLRTLLPSFSKNEQALVSGYHVPGNFPVCWLIPGLRLYKWIHQSFLPPSLSKPITLFFKKPFLNAPHHSFSALWVAPAFVLACVHVCETRVLVLSLLLNCKLLEAKARVFAHNHSINIYGLK